LDSNNLALCFAPLRMEDLTVKMLFQWLLSSNRVWSLEMSLGTTSAREIGIAIVEVGMFHTL
jgi:hypothetical protein